ncbi:hypothetical protein LTR57_022974 [Friedmanniomyces endolithicus]|nr:hypothetical protein LTR94_021811 [Friedmanniomyces endolithicus]KAK0768322.1 hypothetical protein LTR59_017749 [Friedmanniomyces endolithicus]KAK0777116.1 hypothetical protein LTR75_016044 [Friedmanniomyces endolithicus]KAK0895591.1 hypothetical protein LTR57_022974 [Friedmanniomyces endolithicus]KAK0954908.1 hypothetical protein LTS01_023665 [Friedmanniomyces endolithicus]
MSSGTSSSAAASSSGAVCTNGTVVTDSTGTSYTTYCSSDTSGAGGGSFDTRILSSGDFTQCETACSSTSMCGAWTWSPGATTGGSCFLKHLPQSRVSGTAGMVAGIVVSSGGNTSASSATSTSSAAASTSSAAVCQNMQVTDVNGVAYRIVCGSDSSSGSFATQSYAGGNYTQCETYCDSTANCGAWTWAPGATVGGTCFLKPGQQTPTTPTAANAAQNIGVFKFSGSHALSFLLWNDDHEYDQLVIWCINLSSYEHESHELCRHVQLKLRGVKYAIVKPGDVKPARVELIDTKRVHA